jgi:histidine ammonia-lyase
VGLNKDHEIVDIKGKLTDEVIKLSQKFNLDLIHAHSAGVGPEMSQHLVRATMVVRLNSMLFGATGAQPKIAAMYRDFLNNNIVPVVPSRGSIGEADITLLSHIGLAMIGEGYVYYKGKKILARDTLKQAQLKPIILFGKDTLSIISSNAYSAALGAYAVEEMKHILEVAKLVYALSLEALNGNTDPFLQVANTIRPYPSVNQISKDIQNILQGSYLWQKSDERALQDPLSYRTAADTFGAVLYSLNEIQKQLSIQLNSSDDNPAVVLDVSAPSNRYEESSNYVTDGQGLKGAVIPTANFSPLPWVLAFEQAGIALSHASNSSAQRTAKLANPHFTKLSRFLGTKNTVHAYGAIQKVFVSLATENHELALPISFDTYAVAGNIEDVATNAPRVVRRIRRMIDNLYYILGIELMHAAQAINLRLQKNPDLKLSNATKQFFTAYRKIVTFMDRDRVLTPDIENSHNFLKKYKLQ